MGEFEEIPDNIRISVSGVEKLKIKIEDTETRIKKILKVGDKVKFRRPEVPVDWKEPKNYEGVLTFRMYDDGEGYYDFDHFGLLVEDHDYNREGYRTLPDMAEAIIEYEKWKRSLGGE